MKSNKKVIAFSLAVVLFLSMYLNVFAAIPQKESEEPTLVEEKIELINETLGANRFDTPDIIEATLENLKIVPDNGVVKIDGQIKAGKEIISID